MCKDCRRYIEAESCLRFAEQPFSCFHVLEKEPCCGAGKFPVDRQFGMTLHRAEELFSRYFWGKCNWLVLSRIYKDALCIKKKALCFQRKALCFERQGFFFGRYGQAVRISLYNKSRKRLYAPASAYHFFYYFSDCGFYGSRQEGKRKPTFVL